MKRKQRRRLWGEIAIALLLVVTIALWQWQTLARLAIVAAVEAVAHVRLTIGKATVGADRAVFENLSLTSLDGEPIAAIGRLSLAYNLPDLLPGGSRRFGLKDVEADSPRVTIVRHADGSYNVPIPQLPENKAAEQPPAIVRATVRHGSIELVDESGDALPAQRRLYVEDVDVDADISSASRSRYSVGFRYGERPNLLYPVRGRGEIDAALGYNDQRWTASSLPIAGAANFAINSHAIRLRSGMLRNVDARYVGLADVATGAIRPHVAATAYLDAARISIAGLSKPVDGVRGGIDVYDDGLLTTHLDAKLAGVPTSISGGIYGLRAPRVRLTVRGTGDLAILRSAFGQAARLPMRGPLSFSVLVEGPAAKPLTWVDLKSPGITYASASLQSLRGLAAFDGREADVIRFGGIYRGANVTAGGRLALQTQRNAIELLLGARASTDDVPYAGAVLPAIPLNGIALASATDPKAIGVLGTLWGTGATQSVDAVFDVDSRGVGSIGPVHVNGARGSLYARVALDRPHRSVLGLIAARDFQVAPARGALTAALFGGLSGADIGVRGTARLAGSWGSATTQGRLGLSGGTLHGNLFGDVRDEASYGAIVSGTPQLPRIAGSVVVAGGHYRDFDVNGNAGVEYAGGLLRVRNAAAAIGPLFVGASGTIAGFSPGSAGVPRYDLAVQLHSSDVSALLAALQPRVAALVQGSIDGELSLRGAGTAASFAGTMRSPEGSVNGLSFRDLRGAVRGNPASVTLAGGHVVVGSSAIAVNGSATLGGADAGVNAPQVDLADFNDFFDAGDTFSGTGSLAVRAAVRGMRLIDTSGSAYLSRARFRRIELGNVAAAWHSTGSSVDGRAHFGGTAGEVSLAGSVAPAAMRVNLRASAHALDLGTWLPMLGYSVPVTGRLDAQTAVAGTYPDLSMQLHAAVRDGTAGRLAIERFEVTASVSRGRGTIASATLEVPSLTTTASGTFGLRPSDRLGLLVNSSSPNIGAFLKEAAGRSFNVTGRLDSALRIDGTFASPQLHDAIALQSLRYGNLTVPRVAADIDVDRHALNVRDGEVDLARGKALFSAGVPIRLMGSSVSAGSGPISASLTAADVEASNFADVLPKGTQVGGRIDGSASLGGTMRSPEVSGSLTLRDGTFSGPMERSPITAVAGELALRGSLVQLRSSATVGAGGVTANATAILNDLRHPAESALRMDVSAANARLDLPAYFQGTLNGGVNVARERAATPKVSGNLSISNARIPLSAFLNLKGGGQGAQTLPIVAFESLSVSAANNVRVQSGNVDIGAAGEVAIGGTSAAPSLAGSFRSTGGSLSFYRTFNLENGTVTFDPSGGVIPDVNATATTFVADPPTAIRLNVTGPVTSMNLALASEPSYSRQQILGLLVGAQQFGAVRGVQTTGSQSFSAGTALANVGLGQLNTLFTRNLLEPVSSSLASALGFTTVAITTDIQTGLGVSAAKALGKNVRAIFSQTFGYPRTQAITFEASPNAATGYRFNWYTSTGPTLLAQQPAQPVGMDVLNLNRNTLLPPVTGTNGISFSYQRKFP